MKATTQLQNMIDNGEFEGELVALEVVHQAHADGLEVIAGRRLIDADLLFDFLGHLRAGLFVAGLGSDGDGAHRREDGRCHQGSE